ncbi:MAG: dTDP-4-dehydrorhamnose reductase [Inconstantimicrobium porci]|uniref:dTDP-4-dehydrorhamnose reductase n=1 Tax=Inconstantimicrobium porci TaxID=2652291 RepID=UPI002A90C7AB|nr:dTDP-4-dehydrorhamnose reductase [Inconstantimicrobium porci]MDY5912278.1 dTDP-4-dehydrorhamnose reductase [Inconstantimicrobium porci]
MKILITGSNGQLGNELQDIIKTGKAQIGAVSDNIKDAEVLAVDVDKLDITNLKQVKNILNTEKPDVVINCAAATNVDGCENNEDFAFRVNALGPRNLAMVCNEIGAKLVQVSTDYVFSGKGSTPLNESYVPAPVSSYGRTKLLGEKYVEEFCKKNFIVRTAWLYGRVGHNFVYTMMKLGKEKDAITVVNDQRGNPTNANDLAYHILRLIETEEYGVYHCTGKGECSWYDFAKRIIELSGGKCKVNSCTSEEYKTKINPNSADRPEYSSLDNMMLRNTIGDDMRNWEDAIKTFVEEVK